MPTGSRIAAPAQAALSFEARVGGLYFVVVTVDPCQSMSTSGLGSGLALAFVKGGAHVAPLKGRVVRAILLVELLVLTTLETPAFWLNELRGVVTGCQHRVWDLARRDRAIVCNCDC